MAMATHHMLTAATDTHTPMAMALSTATTSTRGRLRLRPSQRLRLIPTTTTATTTVPLPTDTPPTATHLFTAATDTHTPMAPDMPMADTTTRFLKQPYPRSDHPKNENEF